MATNEAGSGKEATRERREKTKKITAVGWGAFFVWLGFVLMVDAGTGAILVGVGVISLCVQVARKYAGLESDGFWMVVAILFVVVGVWELYQVQIPLMAILLIVIGVALILSALRGKGKSK
jgi:hypothetical protein